MSQLATQPYILGVTYLQMLNTVWTKTPSSIKCKLIVYDAVIASKLLYGLEALSLTEADHAKLDAFHIRGLRKILRIKHSFWSRVANKVIRIQANVRARFPPDKQILKMSEKQIRKQFLLFGHLLRAPETDTLNKCSIKANGDRVKTNFRRVGRPRLK
eukprot:15133240-Heterocapsa_arctica.AAC.1